MKKQYHITLAVDIEDPSVRYSPSNLGRTILEHLRYAGIISVFGAGHTGKPPQDVMEWFEVSRYSPETHVLVTLTAPPLVDGPTWQQQNLERMRSFGELVMGWTE